MTAALRPLAASASWDGYVPRGRGRCADCGGSGIVADDGSVTDVVGWPLPCSCAEVIPPRVRALTRAAGPARTTLGGGLYGGAA